MLVVAPIGGLLRAAPARGESPGECLQKCVDARKECFSGCEEDRQGGQNRFTKDWNICKVISTGLVVPNVASVVYSYACAYRAVARAADAANAAKACHDQCVRTSGECYDRCTHPPAGPQDPEHGHVGPPADGTDPEHKGRRQKPGKEPKRPKRVATPTKPKKPPFPQCSDCAATSPPSLCCPSPGASGLGCCDATGCCSPSGSGCAHGAFDCGTQP
ncbi:MAG TPA: hypothetical protein VFA24_04905 [Gaiellaceae bacterium]|nr:hypothetical protein [Gaiellaceae bacterium]